MDLAASDMMIFLNIVFQNSILILGKSNVNSDLITLTEKRKLA